MGFEGFTVEIRDIREEQHLRQWLSEQVNTYNNKNVEKVDHIWIEPAFGSSVGVPDASLSFRGLSYGVELKHFEVNSKGVLYKIRPVQRRFHVMGVRNGKRLLVLATVAQPSGNQLVMIRGDRLPLRDYAFMEGSGCEEGIVQTVISTLEQPFYFFMRTMIASTWWPKEEDYTEGQKGLVVTQPPKRKKF